MRKMNDINVRFRLRPGMLKTIVGCLAALMALSLPRALAGTDMKAMTPPSCCSENDWTIELSSGAGWSNVRSGQPNQAYTIVPVSLTASMKLDDVSLDHFLGGWLRGYSEFCFSADYGQIVHGPETHYEGLFVGPRYNFVQPGWMIVPFVEGGIGFDFADSDPEMGGLGQDFNFTFGVAAGVRYNINDDWFVRLAVDYRHVSNAGLSEPQFPNHPIDSLGPRLSVGYSF